MEYPGAATGHPKVLPGRPGAVSGIRPSRWGPHGGLGPEGAGVIASGGQRQRPHRMNLNHVRLPVQLTIAQPAGCLCRKASARSRGFTNSGSGPALRLFAEDAPLDLAAVVLQGVVQVHGGGVRGRFRLAVADRAVDRLVLLDGGVGMAAHAA